VTAAQWVLSIDFGTSYTVVASRVHGRAAEVIEIDGERRVPSVVMITDDFGVVIGRAADEMAAAAPSRVLRSPKSRLGDPAPIILGGRPFQATSLVAEVLAKVYDEALRHHGSTPESTRLTYPASWSGQRRQQLLRAAELAGLENVTLVPEPVAAAIAYADESAAPVGSIVLVYDLGGGTLDCAALRTTDVGFEFLGRPGGDRHLGGELFDELLANMIGERLPPDVWEQLQLGEDTVWRQAWVGLRREARRAKELLSTQTTVDILIALPTGIREMRITRVDVDSVVGPYIADSVQILRDTAADAGVAIADIGAIYLVGGGSRMPLVETLLAEAFPGTLISRRGDPKAAVALGGTHPAAIVPQAALAQAADQVTDPRPQAALANESVTESIPVVGVERTGQQSTRLLANWPSPEAAVATRTRRHRVPALIAAVALALAIGGLGVWAAGRDDPNPKAAADTVPSRSVDSTPDSASSTATSASSSSTSAPPTSTTIVATTTTALPTDDLLAVVTANPEASSFRRIVEAAGLQQLLVDPQPFTLFVPTNDGFTAAFSGTGLSVDAIVARPAAAFALVAQHLVVDPTLTASSEGTFTTRAGTTLTVAGGRVDGNVFGADVWRGTNGNAWPIEGVLLPPGFSIVDVPVSSLSPATPTTAKRAGGTSPTTVAPSVPAATTAPTAPPTTASSADPTVPPTTAATSGRVPPGLEGGDPSSSIATIKQAGFSHVTPNYITCPGQGNVVSSYSPQGTQPFSTTIVVTICN
jgi:molecular chaperone DnaK